MLLIVIASLLFSAVLAAPAGPAGPSNHGRPPSPLTDILRISGMTFQSTDTKNGDAHDFKFQLNVDNTVQTQCTDYPGPKTNFHLREVNCQNKDFTVFIQDFGREKYLHLKFYDRAAREEKVMWNINVFYLCRHSTGMKSCRQEHPILSKLRPGPFPMEKIITVPRQDATRQLWD